jgi:uncharacterized protein YegL
LTRQCVVPSNNNPASVQTFTTYFTASSSSLWLTSFQLTANGGVSGFASEIVCPGWTVSPSGAVSGGSVFLPQGVGVTVTCTWVPQASEVANGYSLTVSGASSSGCAITSGTSTTPLFNVRNTCTVTDCTVPNPDLVPRCGLRVLLILDESSSICQTNSVEQVRSAFLVFVNSLNTGPLSNVTNYLAIVNFALTGTIITPQYVPVNAVTIGSFFTPYITTQYDPCAASSLTAWGAGLDAAYNFVSLNNNVAPDMTVMVTDGEPNVPSDSPLPTACQAANRIKQLPSHMFVVGVGAAFSNQDALATISGPTSWNGNSATFPQADYQVLASFNDLANALTNIVVAFCCPSPAVVTPFIATTSPCSQGLPFVTISASSAPDSRIGSVSFVLTNQGSLQNQNSLLNCTPPLVGDTVSFPNAVLLNSAPSAVAVCTINVASITPFTFTFNDFTGVPPVCQPILGSPSAFDITAAPPTLQITVGSVTNARCGLNNGAVHLNVVGGVAPLSYLWSTGATTADLSGVGPGIYSVTVTDSSGCSGTLGGIQVIQVGSPTVALSGITSVSCNGASNGAVAISVSGGQGPYTYVWSNGAVTQNIAGLTAGQYSVTVTDSNSCQTIGGPFTVTQPASGLLVVLASKTNVACFGQATGSIQISPSGGTPPYTYIWSNSQTTQNLTNLPAGAAFDICWFCCFNMIFFQKDLTVCRFVMLTLAV